MMFYRVGWLKHLRLRETLSADAEGPIAPLARPFCQRWATEWTDRPQKGGSEIYEAAQLIGTALAILLFLNDRSSTGAGVCFLDYFPQLDLTLRKKNLATTLHQNPSWKQGCDVNLELSKRTSLGLELKSKPGPFLSLTPNRQRLLSLLQRVKKGIPRTYTLRLSASGLGTWHARLGVETGVVPRENANRLDLPSRERLYSIVSLQPSRLAPSLVR
ncbi:hypothetical protein B0H67DRAFT_594717 [Lasiosphaeris hirsuta]|uniref:Uncharacterized protein n=1 Tax=Lasiosphaeris hirsuta TaxID=260670 RepID=A0AA39ZXW8_9PEZI|nr:hypothetical protein B0H67DRAFT_594717 [Lasiosphaeris hirsuta]